MPKSGTALTSQRSLTTIKKHVKSTLILDGRSVYGYLQNVSDDILSRNWHNIDVSNIQSYSSQRLFKLFAANDTSFSASLLTHIRMLEDNYRVTAFKTSKERYPTAQKYLNELREKFDHTDSYTGFVMPNTIRDQISRMVRNMLTSDNAAGALFVNLQDNYEVDEFEVHDCDRVYFEIRLGEKRETPFVYENGTKVYLDVANFLWQPMDADAGRVVGNNLLRPALRTIFTKLEFFDNLRKVLKNQAWPKIKIVIDEKAVANTAPPEVKNNGKLLIEYMNSYIGKIEDQLTGIDPDQNIIIYDTIKEISFLESSSKFDPTPIAKLLDSEQISGLKTPPSVVGKGGSTRTAEGLASAELVIFRRCIKAIRALVETLYSRAYTLALRLKGFGGYAEFKLDEFSLRPPEESAQYDAIRQNNVIEAWIVGAIGDKEMQLKLRQSHSFDGEPPDDAMEREDPRTQKADMQTERTPESRKSKEAKREETRKNQNIGQEKKSTKSKLQLYLENFSIDKLDDFDFSPDTFLAIKKDKVDWNKLYNEGSAHWADNLQPSKFAQDFAKKMVDKNKKTVLEIGCGNGRDSILFALAKRKVTAIDLVPEAIKIAESNAKKSKVKIDFQVGNAENLKFEDSSFSALFTLSVLHSTNIKKSIQEIHRVLKKNSIAFVYIYSNVEKIDGTENSFISVDEFIDLVKKTGFEISDIYTSSEDEYDEAGERHSVIVSELKK